MERNAGFFYRLLRRRGGPVCAFGPAGRALWVGVLFGCISVLAPGAAITASDPVTTGELQLLRIGTGGSSGVYYPVGKLIAMGLTREAAGDPVLRGRISVAQNSAGSVENVRNLGAGDIELGLVQADIASFALHGTGLFRDASIPLRALASLYSEKLHIVARTDAGIHALPDLKGKRISIDEPGSGTLAVMRLLLEACRMSEEDLSPSYLKPIFNREKLASGELDGFAMMAGAPMAAVTELQEAGINLIPVEPAVAEAIHRRVPYLTPGRIDAGIYPGIPETPTLEVNALLVVRADMAEELAYAITRTLFSDETLQIVREGHPQGQAITLDTALNGISIPLHPGAELFYRDQNIIK